MWLHKYELVPAIVLALLCLAFGGWAGLVVGFFWSTVMLYHATFCINSLAHVHGRTRYITGDDSQNNWLLALFTMGEGWHNNHHAYQSSVRQGFRWWETDLTYYCLKAHCSLGLVWNLKTPPIAVLRNEQRLGSRVIARVAAQLAASYNPERIAATIHSTIGASARAALRDSIAGTQQRAEHVLARLYLPQVPTEDEMMSRATAMFASTPSLDEIVHRAHLLILEFVSARLCCRPGAGDAL
jgi:stearoyl-CoA desaturase (delta-9 desaturase)